MIPRATYRLQFGKEFGFKDGTAIAPYLAELGISHVYASPYLLARPGSKHGYDITDHNALNCELGSEEDFHRMNQAFHEHSLEQILDFVPNHVGVGGADNPFWLDVLEWGRDSRYASWFDIDWDSHSEYLSGKLLVPFLADQYGMVLDSGKIELKFDAQEGAFAVWLYDTHKLPIAPPTYSEIFLKGAPALKGFVEAFAALRDAGADRQSRAAELKKQLAQSVHENQEVRRAVEAALEHFRGTPGDSDSWDKLDFLIRLQHWRPTHFRVAADDINYRRFFNISELAGIHMELPEVFEHTHQLVLHLVQQGHLQGLRIDHIDGLYDPKEYLERLRARVPEAFYLVVEKILTGPESLREDWPVEGTSGYEFCAQATALLVDTAAEGKFTRFYQEFTGQSQSFAAIVRESKIKILENELASELESLARDAVRVARLDRCTADFTRHILRRALKEIIAGFPVYRTYVDGGTLSETDERYIHWAVAQAPKYEQELDKSVFEFLERLLKGQLAKPASSDFFRHSALRCAMKAQQLSGPVMAKGLEDTALYRYNRFVALNDVGASPEQFGVSVASFHKENRHRAEQWPHTMLATSTHDVKHGEDARARLAALSLYPDEWAAKVTAWSRILRARRGDVQGTAPPERNDEYLFFQNLLATWPASLIAPYPLEKCKLAKYCERLQGAMIKSLREARLRSNWIAPNTSYETAVTEFVRDALNPEISQTFLDAFLPFQQQIAELGVRNSLVQVFLKITSPGVPDFYQGSELWDLSLPDPDNRRPVDFRERRTLLSELTGNNQDRRSLLANLLQHWHDGGIKLAITQLLLKFRKENHELFEGSSYEPLQDPEGVPPNVCAFLRRKDQQRLLAIALLDAHTPCQDHPHQSIRADSSISRWRDVLTDRIVPAPDGSVDLAQIFSVVPIALLVPAHGPLTT
ncbi:MAG TPA: malto-oligosyltrehalose synthase [Candidatus Sulfotelmatobacter sp.]|nr:malto-oligosyltrehalose synthase [Candidatus Sulfotelmatobacter sp.]